MMGFLLLLGSNSAILIGISYFCSTCVLHQLSHQNPTTTGLSHLSQPTSEPKAAYEAKIWAEDSQYGKRPMGSYFPAQWPFHV
jgi:hypothetical protein